MAGLYIHVPFCKQACHYCDFHFSTLLQYRQPVLEALCAEIRLQRDYLDGANLNTIYLGGGTPSLLSKQELVALFDAIASVHEIAPNAEVTLEANPDDLSPEYLEELAQTPVNRLSIGIQSFRDADLKQMNRAHNSNEALACVDAAKQAGFTNITIDLIYGLPNLADEAWRNNLQRALDLRVQHISAYCLTVESGTAWHHFVAKGKIADVDQTLAAQQFETLQKLLTEAGYIQYEISNFGLPEYFSRHNSSYWKGTKYLGIGPSAHSYNGTSRQWNVANNGAYIKAIEAGRIPAEVEDLSLETRYNDYVLTGMRTIWGCAAQEIKSNFGEVLFSHFEKEARPHLQTGDMVETNGSFILSPAGRLRADGIASDLFFVA